MPRTELFGAMGGGLTAQDYRGMSADQVRQTVAQGQAQQGMMANLIMMLRGQDIQQMQFEQQHDLAERQFQFSQIQAQIDEQLRRDKLELENMIAQANEEHQRLTRDISERRLTMDESVSAANIMSLQSTTAKNWQQIQKMQVEKQMMEILDGIEVEVDIGGGATQKMSMAQSMTATASGLPLRIAGPGKLETHFLKVQDDQGNLHHQIIYIDPTAGTARGGETFLAGPEGDDVLYFTTGTEQGVTLEDGTYLPPTIPVTKGATPPSTHPYRVGTASAVTEKTPERIATEAEYRKIGTLRADVTSPDWVSDALGVQYMDILMTSPHAPRAPEAQARYEQRLNEARRVARDHLNNLWKGKGKIEFARDPETGQVGFYLVNHNERGEIVDFEFIRGDIVQ